MGNPIFSNRRQMIMEEFDCNENPKGKTPFKCPVCNGNGLVPNGFYSNTSGMWSGSSAVTEECRSCNGKGIVWNIESD